MTDSAISELPVGHVIARRRRDVGHNRTAVAIARPRPRSAVAAPRPRKRTKADFAQYRKRSWANVIPLAFSIAVVVALWTGWLNRDDSGLTPESGVGYGLGIAGGSLMLLLLLYPLRKRMPSLRVFGTVTFWFRAHMVLGLFGAVLVLWHANFRLGSINSSVAIIVTLVVAVSGLVGRYLYSKIHLGLHGRKAVVREILADAVALKGYLGVDLPVADRVITQLEMFAQLSTTAPRGALGGLLLLPLTSWRGSVVRTRLIADARQAIAVEGNRRGWSRAVRRRRLAGVADLVTLHVAAVKQAAAFAFYERLFRLWHVFHVPLFFLLVIAAIVHIFAAHFY
jgi:hypothetical protein